MSELLSWDEIFNRKWLSLNKRKGDPSMHLYLSVDEIDMVNEAMEEYAKQEAIGFAEWIDSNLMFRGSERTWVNAPNDTFPTTEELYLAYQQSKTKQP